MAINLKAPDYTEVKPRILVFGVGGAGGNAVNNMVASKLEGVEFIVANTDAQALAHSKASRRVQIGNKLTSGLGAGSRPDIGTAAAEESTDEIKDCLAGSHIQGDTLQHMHGGRPFAKCQRYVFQRDDGFCQNESVLYGT